MASGDGGVTVVITGTGDVGSGGKWLSTSWVEDGGGGAVLDNEDDACGVTGLAGGVGGGVSVSGNLKRARRSTLVNGEVNEEL